MRKKTSSAAFFTPSHTHITKTPQWGYNILEKTGRAPQNRSVPVQPHTFVAASASEIQRLSQHYISFTHTISFAQVQPHGGANKQISIPHPRNAMNRGILHSWWQKQGWKERRSPPWSGNINNWDATAVTPSTSVHKQWTDTVPLSDSIHTPPSWASQARRHTRCQENGSGGYTPKKISTHPLSPHIKRERKEKMRRWRGGDVGDRARRSLGCCGRTNLSSIPPPLSPPPASRLSLSKPFPCSFLLGSRPSRAAVLPSYLRLAGRLRVPAVGSGPGAGGSASVCVLRWAGP